MTAGTPPEAHLAGRGDGFQKINEKPGVVQEYESSKTIPNQQILAKLEVRLPLCSRLSAPTFPWLSSSLRR